MIAACSSADTSPVPLDIPVVPADLPMVPENDWMEPGRYLVHGPGYASAPAGGWPAAVIVTVPVPGWYNRSAQSGSGIAFPGLRPGIAFLYMGSVANVVADPCSHDPNFSPGDVPEDLLDPPVGPTVDDLASALTSIRGVLSTPPADAALAGFTGTQFSMTIDSPCETFQLWVTPDSPELWGFSTFDGWQHLVWILDVDGLRFAIDASWAPETPSKVRGELLQMVNSLEIQP